ncbi:MAG TPA: tetratricopeptide repeat protein, partial [Candidatus Polarisedimenticolaceae bacterium]|nr:tetratricopeptide repeat protein [Candidatus Polarisedimenticolaceae bacterium]
PRERRDGSAGRRALERGDFATASTVFSELWREQPDSAVAATGYALAELQLGHDGRALSIVIDALNRHPDNAELHELLGDLRNRDERVDAALREWREAFKRSPNDRLREKILKGEREQHAGGGYDLAATAHFNLRYDGDVDQALAQQLLDFLEDQYWSLTETFDHAPDQPVTVLVYPLQQFRDVTQTPEWVGGLYDGKIRVPLGGLRRIDARAAAVLRHELTHAVVHSLAHGRCPRWLHEGLAQRSEGHVPSPAERRQVAQRLSEGDPARWEDRGFSYPLALSLTRYLEREYGFHAVLRVLDRLGDGLSLDAALHEVCGLDYASLCRRWAELGLEETP